MIQIVWVLVTGEISHHAPNDIKVEFSDRVQYYVAAVFRQGEVPSLLQNHHFGNDGEPIQSGATKLLQMEKGCADRSEPGHLCVGKYRALCFFSARERSK